MSDLRPRVRGPVRQPPFARHGELRRSRPWATAIKWVAAVLAVVLVSGTSIAALAIWDVAKDVTKSGVKLIGETDGPPPNIGAIDGGVNLLIAGSDSGGGDTSFGKRGEHLNDVTMLLHISQDHSNATVISFPRDMFVSIPSCPDGKGGNYAAISSEKLNVSLSRGGLACTVLTVSQLTGLPIQFAAKIEFDGVIQMANAVGGVPVCVGKAIHDQQIHLDLDAGMHTLSGLTALQFLRSRYGVGDGSDLGRISNQQVFLSALARTIKSADTLNNPLKVFALAQAAGKNMQLSTSLQSVNTLISIALALKNIDLNQVAFVQYPTNYGSSNGQSGVLPITDAASILFSAIKDDKALILTGTTGLGSTLAPGTGTTPTPTGTATGTPTTPADAVTLPSSIHGQTAVQETCSKGQRAGG